MDNILPLSKTDILYIANAEIYSKSHRQAI